MQLLTPVFAPPGLEFKRDNADFMNNFFTNVTARSFSDIEEHWKTMSEDTKYQQEQNIQNSIQKMKPIWKTEIEKNISSQMDTYEISYYKSREKHYNEDVMSTAALSLI